MHIRGKTAEQLEAKLFELRRRGYRGHRIPQLVGAIRRRGFLCK